MEGVACPIAGKEGSMSERTELGSGQLSCLGCQSGLGEGLRCHRVSLQAWVLGKVL